MSLFSISLESDSRPIDSGPIEFSVLNAAQSHFQSLSTNKWAYKLLFSYFHPYSPFNMRSMVPISIGPKSIGLE